MQFTQMKNNIQRVFNFYFESNQKHTLLAKVISQERQMKNKKVIEGKRTRGSLVLSHILNESINTILYKPLPTEHVHMQTHYTNSTELVRGIRVIYSHQLVYHLLRCIRC